MPLQKQFKSVVLNQGVDKKTDRYVSVKPRRVENRVFRGGTLERCPGSQTLTNSVAGGGTLTAGESLDAYQSSLVRIQGNQMYSLGASANAWKLVGATPPLASVTKTSLVRNNTTQAEPDWATTGGVAVLAWSGGYAVRDSATGAFYYQGTTANVNDWSRVVAVGNRYLHVYSRDKGLGTLNLKIVDALNPAAAPVDIALRNDISVPAQYALDAVYCPASNCVLVAYVTDNPSTATGITCVAVSVAGSVLATTGNTTTAAIIGLSIIIDPATSTQDNFYIVANVLTPVTYLLKCTLSASGTSLSALSLFGTPIHSVSGCSNAIGFVTVSGSTATMYQSTSQGIGTATLSFSAGPSGWTLRGQYTGANISSRGFTYAGRNCFTLVVPETFGATTVNASPVAMVVDTSLNVLARFLQNTVDITGVFISNGTANFPVYRLSNALTFSDGSVQALFSERGRTAYTSGFAGGLPVDVTTLGLTGITLTQRKASQVPRTQVGNGLHVGGAVPQLFDGANLVEEGFNLVPVVTTTLNGTAPITGNYGYCALYSWVDNTGQLQRGAVSTPVKASPAAQGVLVTIQALGLTAKQNVQVEVYRTTTNGIQFYKLSTPGSIYFSATASSVTFQDPGTTDTALQSGELLYTTQGVLDNFAPPPYSIACEHKTRLVVAGLENPYEWRSSSKVSQGENVRFNPAWGGFVPPDTGPISALASQDGNLIIFTRDTAYLIQGDGPDLLGNNPWPDPQIIASIDGGPVSSVVVNAAEGVFFQSPRGWEVLARDLSSNYVGADVEAYSGWVARVGTLRPEVQEIWFQVDDGSDLVGQLLPNLTTSAGGVVLVYNFYYKGWTVLTNRGAQDACYFQGNYTRVKSDGAVLAEQPGTFRDSGAYYSSVYETPWIKPGDFVQGYERMWTALLMGRYGSDASLLWEVAYNYSTTWNPLDAKTIVGNGVYTVGDLFQVRRKLRIQRCESIRFRFTDLNLSGSGEGIGLTSLDFEFGVQGRGWTLPAGKSK